MGLLCSKTSWQAGVIAQGAPEVPIERAVASFETPILDSAETEEEQRRNWPWIWALRLDMDDWREAVRSGPKYVELPIAVGDRLFLGDYSAYENRSRLKELGITHVANMAALLGSPTREYDAEGITYLELPGFDEDGFPILDFYLERVQRFWNSAKNSGGSLMVNCAVGWNRSGAIVTALILLDERRGLLDVVGSLREKRGYGFLSNESFQMQIVTLARREGLLGPAPGEPGCLVEIKNPLFEFEVPSIRADYEAMFSVFE